MTPRTVTEAPLRREDDLASVSEHARSAGPVTRIVAHGLHPAERDSGDTAFSTAETEETSAAGTPRTRRSQWRLLWR